MSYHNAYRGKENGVRLDSITWDETANKTGPGRIDFGAFGHPDVSVDGSARFATHDIVGGTTVRQRIGQDPAEVSVNGVCNEETAAEIDLLRNAETVSLKAPQRISGSLMCQVASTSTTPQEKGGTVDMDKGEFLYNFTINLVEITPP